MNYKLPLILVFTSLIVACQQENQYSQIKGYTMGTSYHITVENKSTDSRALQHFIDKRLKEINQKMSTYIKDSEISLFNTSNTTKCHKLSSDTMFVIKNALDISYQTNGMFDVTLAPLIEIWGFDKKPLKNNLPSQKTINSLLSGIGSEKIIIKNNCIAKKNKDLSINLSAIAKGYAVDEVAKIIRAQDINNYLVEIGGEIASRGVNARGILWHIAIESPITEKQTVQNIFTPKGFGVATSGDYRNYFEKDGKRFSHTIDPTTGYPITHHLASVTVLHKETMIADALATALMVMGPEKSLKFANKNHLPIFMLVKNKVGFEEVYSKSFRPFLK